MRWYEVEDVLRGLKLALLDERRYSTAEFKVENVEEKTIIAAGMLDRYTRSPSPG